MVKGALLVFALAGCTEEIAPGVYLCGEEQLCPEGMACNGPDNICVTAEEAQPFVCGEAVTDPSNDDVPTSGLPVTGLNCVSALRESRGCLLPNDLGDWFQFDIPGNCVAVQIEARVSFPVAFETVAMQLSTEDSTPTRVDVECAANQTPIAGQVARCFKMTVANGSHHAIGLVHSGERNCGGICANNRYTFELQLTTP